VSAPASNPVPRVNRRVFGAFAGLLTAFVLAIIGWDVWLYSRTGDGSETISWSVALLAASDPLVTHAFVLAVGLVVGGLLVHFFHLRLPSPAEVAERERLRARVADLEAGIRHVVTREADNICWMDAYTSLAHLVGLTFDPLLIPADRMLANCHRFVADLHAGRPYGADRLTEGLRWLQARVAELDAENARRRGPASEGRPEPPGLTWERYNR
jgi:hypothetical protein